MASVSGKYSRLIVCCSMSAAGVRANSDEWTSLVDAESLAGFAAGGACSDEIDDNEDSGKVSNRAGKAMSRCTGRMHQLAESDAVDMCFWSESSPPFIWSPPSGKPLIAHLLNVTLFFILMTSRLLVSTDGALPSLAYLPTSYAVSGVRLRNDVSLFM